MVRFEPEYGELVRRRLEEKGWSNREAAARAGGFVSHTLVREIRVHGYVPTVEAIVALALALGDDPNLHLDTAGKPAHIRHIETASRVRRRSTAGVRPVAVGLAG